MNAPETRKRKETTNEIAKSRTNGELGESEGESQLQLRNLRDKKNEKNLVVS